MRSLNPVFTFVVSELANRIATNLNDSDRVVTMYIAGGVAVGFYCDTRATDDLDAFYDARVGLGGVDMLVQYEDRDGSMRTCYLDTNYNPTIGLLHENFDRDAVEWEGVQILNQKIRVKVLSPLDLAVTKIDRYSDQDVQDILELAKQKLFSPESFERRAIEAMNACPCNRERTQNSIRLLAASIRKAQSTIFEP